LYSLYLLCILGAIVNQPTVKRVNGRFVWNENTEYALTAEVQIDRTGETVKYIPNLEVQIPDQDSLTLTGAVTVVPRESVDVDLNLAGVLASPLVVKGNVFYFRLYDFLSNTSP
jgi:hypothetical protein